MTDIKKSSLILSKRHPAFKKLITVIGDLDFKIPLWQRVDDAIIYAVIGQMLSNSTSASIIAGLKKKFRTSDKIILWAAKTASQNGPLYGVSQKKRKALRAWFEFSRNNKAACRKWHSLPLPGYRQEITRIWGFGRWSADMIAIFYLARMDVWPESDAGIKRAIAAVFGKECDGYVKDCVKGCETVAALYLWELINRSLLNNFKENG